MIFCYQARLEFLCFSIIALLCTYKVGASNDNVRSRIFKRTPVESALIGHVIKKTHAANDIECLIHCNNNELCLSYNYKNTGVGLPVCQLSDETKETKPSDLIEIDDFYYYGPIKSPCLDGNPCQNGGTCQAEMNHPTLRHRCVCAAGFNGLNCDSLVTDPKSNFDFIFPRRDSKDYVKLQKMPSLTNFTISFTVNLTLNGDGTFISYATRTYSNAIFFHQRHSKWYLWILNKYMHLKDKSGAFVPTLKADGHWHHVVVTWESHNGKTQLYIDGKLNHTGTGFKTGVTIGGNGLFVLGNDQDGYGTGYKSTDALVGHISRVNVWDKVLSAEVITTLLRSCGNEVGTAVAWNDFRKATTHGLANLNEPSQCT
ncbi:sushi, von Willebrand factor type A, EGF and pentraxin domain-containing protein 1 [Exaiptasia diaphana]|uniref:Uncharacterized protein n=1 Tax=Exaiptasia diaphana TaxID=2652724 RepID=A0A913Z015_EXADI|nr:sushi, von Willebrand factor type A, EGF and pentraxin domain-containing protein 1 [Exaiptasia diaphana]XP_020916330.1 sushi, von Willebrand factor type A, EGF and pentraxin domain-containing protein 1 [Exaiptasia diaphana]XP_020917045.1 sushi, von Willebrand factor type A, EGF and pentraxin domain-containing protein 1 [Exaiptasia diaphana]XP_028519711.1 sushi, von Willebrand factor type A, EGF and pentraxin domain-containing protein 1 [Exaiptasia diaphana]KXJ30217.1 Sushi, von Willebrand fa